MSSVSYIKLLFSLNKMSFPAIEQGIKSDIT